MAAANLKIVTAAQMVALEQASERQGVSTDRLMESAGLAVAEAVRSRLGGVAGAKILVLVGPGNNGADGLVAARHLMRWGAQASIYLATHRPTPDPKMELALEYGVAVFSSAEDPALTALDSHLHGCRLVLDAVLGTGRARQLEGSVKEQARRINAWRTQSRDGGRDRQVFAMDLPTGLNSDTGQTDPNCIAADQTLALGFPKVGLLTFPGAGLVGQLRVLDIGLPGDLEPERDIDLELLSPDWVGGHLPTRPLDSHKGTFGHVLIVAGSRNYAGAAFLAAQAAVRAGAGLVTLATPESVYPIAAGKLTEVIHLPLPEDDEGLVLPAAAELIRSNISRYDALAVGCGLGQSEGTRQFMERLVLDQPQLPIPLVIDADGLNNLSRLESWWERLAGTTVLTPHPGEMATLAGTPTSEIQRDRIAAARKWADYWKVGLVLKGAHTVVARSNQAVRVSPFANPGLASGGTGDVLTGIIGGLMAQGLSVDLAAACGVYLHGQAGANAALDVGEAGLTATDLVQRLPQTIGQLRHVNSASLEPQKISIKFARQQLLTKCVMLYLACSLIVI